MKIKKMVHIVGAGPGDPGLMTVRGRDLIRQADVLVVDALVNPFLFQFSEKAQVIFVGKRGPGAKHGSSQVLSQSQINQLLVRLAKTGQRIVRLKGGDPFVFGRGGEEMEALKKSGIGYEIVPGITSATSVPAYAGIPVSDRRWASQVTFITGHEQKEGSEKGPIIDWPKISQHGTLVILMGVTQWPIIRRQLLNHAWPVNMPVAAIESGTTAAQRTLTATLKNSELFFNQKKLMAPAVLVVGRVAALARKNAWINEVKPLLDKTVVVTRAAGQNESLIDLLKDAGANVIECPAIVIRPLSSRIGGLLRFDWIVFLSANAVRVFKDTGAMLPENIRVCAVGPATAAALRAQGWPVHKMPSQFNARGVLGVLGSVKGKKIFLPRVQNGPRDLVQALQKKGAIVFETPLYETRPAPAPSAALKKIILNQADAVTFTSASTARHFVSFFNNKERRQLFRRARAISIGPSTSKELKTAGFLKIIQSSQSTLESLLKSVR